MEDLEALDPVEAAEEAGLRYVTDRRPGIRRESQGEEFRYVGTDGKEITSPKVLARIKSLAIPPAWTDVWISPIANGHIQATGRDVKGRKQYRYHPKWREFRDATKYHKMLAFGDALPTIREQIRQDLERRDLSRERVLAAVIRLMDETAIRVGNEEYARENHSYGLTTLEHRHVDVSGETLHFHFQGKAGKDHVIDLRDRRAAKIVKRLEDLPGQELFQYVDHAGERRAIESTDVNQYLHQVAGEEFTAKDFRTWHGTVHAAQALRDLGAAETKTDAKHKVTEAIKTAAELLGNTPTICRKCYVNPKVVDAYLEGALARAFERGRAKEVRGLEAAEAAVLALLREREAAEQRHAS